MVEQTQKVNLKTGVFQQTDRVNFHFVLWKKTFIRLLVAKAEPILGRIPVSSSPDLCPGAVWTITVIALMSVCFSP